MRKRGEFRIVLSGPPPEPRRTRASRTTGAAPTASGRREPADLRARGGIGKRLQGQSLEIPCFFRPRFVRQAASGQPLVVGQAVPQAGANRGGEGLRRGAQVQAVGPVADGGQVAHHDRLAGRQVLFQLQRLHRARHRQIGVGHDQHVRLTGEARQAPERLHRQPDDARRADQRRVRLLFRPDQHDRAPVEVRPEAPDEGGVHAPVDHAKEDDERTLQSRQFGNRLFRRRVLPEVEIDAVRQEVRRAAHAGDALLQVFADGHDDVGPGDDFFFHPLQRFLVEARPLAEIVHAVVHPAADGQRPHEVGDDRQGRHGDGRRRQGGDDRIEPPQQEPAIEPAVEAGAKPGPHARVEDAGAAARRAGGVSPLMRPRRPKPLADLAEAAPQGDPVEPGRSHADGVDPRNRMPFEQPAGEVLAAGGMAAPVVGEDQQGMRRQGRLRTFAGGEFNRPHRRGPHMS